MAAKRVQITMEENLLIELDRLADEYFMNRSAFLSMLVNQKLRSEREA